LRALPVDLDLAPHRAVYAMRLASTMLSPGVTGATGYMTYKFGDTCDGWITESKTALTLMHSDGAPVSTTLDFVTWESKDGLRYRFRLKNTREGSPDEEISGSATLDGQGQGGVAKFTLPEEKTLRLGKGTLFPTEHTVRLIEMARKGEHLMERVLFDGSVTDSSFDVNAIIGNVMAPAPATAKPAPAAAAEVDGHLLALPSWNMALAFYPTGSSDALPDYEVGLRYYQNGVADQMLQSYGDFSIRGTLQKLEALPRPQC
jgi:hypothetical protein